MIPLFDSTGKLPPGIHQAELARILSAIWETPYRRTLLAGLQRAIVALKAAGCQTIYLDGSFVTTKQIPVIMIACYSTVGMDVSRLDPVFRDFSNGKIAQKSKYKGEFFPAEITENGSGFTFLEFFQTDKETTTAKALWLLT